MAKNKLTNRSFVVLVAMLTIISLAGLSSIFIGGGVPKNTAETGNNIAPPATSVACSTSEDFHIHPHLTILLDGEEITLPENIGIEPGCTREIHTHGSDGIIHVESDSDKGYTFSDFLSVLGFALQQPGYIVRLTVNGEFNNNDPNFKLEDGQEIVLEYISPPIEGMDVEKL